MLLLSYIVCVFSKGKITQGDYMNLSIIIPSNKYHNR
jgi:hypothetical protein